MAKPKKCNRCDNMAQWKNRKPKTSKYPLYLCDKCLSNYTECGKVIDDYDFIK